ncbi:MCE family protein [Rhodococcus qingshengii]|uniref:MCE family protein n=1 Tax=Rhodococcus qingshengii TaxID=334542 RepID=UPI0024B97960|nr:MlaD family protein [Rhodococcus qingshengii]MDJ0441101.1 MlaD family protein [Rhodococcus qingshengii]
MLLSRFVRFQLTIFSILTVVALAIMGIVYMQIPSQLGIGRYTVKVELPSNGGLYTTANVSYRGVTVGTVTNLALTTDGIEATLRLDSGIGIPSDLDANVHSRSAIGEQYVDLVPRTTSPPYLSDGDVIPLDRTSVPQPVGPLIDTVNRGLEAIPQQSLSTFIDESYNAFNGTGTTLQRLFDSAGALARDSAENVDPITNLIADAAPVLQAEAASSNSIREWASNVNALTTQLAVKDPQVRDILVTGRAAADEATSLFQNLSPATPILLANAVSLGQVAVTYNAALEQIFVILPQGASAMEVITYPNRGGTDSAYLSFNLNLNLPEPCTVGFLPASERRDGSAVDSPTRTAQPLYCALPQSDPNDVRGARNYPCADKPGKRAPTVEICKSDEEYQPLGTNPWIGESQSYVDNPEYDPGATPAAAAAQHPPSVGTASYDTATGNYVASDGLTYTQADLAKPAGAQNKEYSWQSMLSPPV